MGKRRYTVTSVMMGAIFGSIASGLSSGLFGLSLGQPSFYESLSLSADPTSPSYSHTTSIIGASTGVWFAGGFFGSLMTGPLSERIGRIRGFQVAAICHIIGGILQAASVNQAMYLVSRVIAGLAAGQTFSAMTVYYSEISLPTTRGLVSSMHGLAIEGAAAASSWIGLGCLYANAGSFGWRFTASLVPTAGVCFLIATFFVPESPRWLLRHGRHDEALEIITSLHRDMKTGDDSMGRREFELMSIQQIDDDEAIRLHGKWQLFTMATYRKRLAVAFFVIFSAQNTGVLVINNYSILIYGTLGLSNAESVAVSAGWITWTCVTVAIGSFLADVVGRRAMLLLGFGGCFGSLAVFCGVAAKYAETMSQSYAIASVTMIYVFAFFYGAGISPHQFTLVTEIFPNHLRSTASCISISALFITDVVWLNVAPIAFVRIAWKIYIVFIALSILSVLNVYLFVPKTSGIPLEELDSLFGNKVAAHLSDIKTDDVESKGTHQGAESVQIEVAHAGVNTGE